MDEKQQQELIYKINIYQQQIQQLQQQLQAVDNGILELSELSVGLDTLSGSEGKEIMAPFGRGIFVKAELKSEELLVDIGSKNLIKKSIPETKEVIEKQLKRLEEVKEEIKNSLNGLNEEVTSIINSVNEGMKENGED